MARRWRRASASTRSTRRSSIVTPSPAARGAIRVTLFRNRGQFSKFDEAVAYALATGNPVDPVPTRRRLTRLGVHMNAEQALTGTLGLFVRAGYADGSIEPYDFTDIDRTVQVGGALAGKGWGRTDDRIGAGAGGQRQFPPRTGDIWRRAGSACWSAMADCPTRVRSRSPSYITISRR